MSEGHALPLSLFMLISLLLLRARACMRVCVRACVRVCEWLCVDAHAAAVAFSFETSSLVCFHLRLSPVYVGDVRSEVEVFASRKGHVTDWHFDFMENFTFQLRGRCVGCGRCFFMTRVRLQRVWRAVYSQKC